VFDGQPLANLKAPGRTVVRMPGLADGSRQGDNAARLVELLERHRPDIVQTHLTLDRNIAKNLVGRVPTVAFAHNYVGLCPSASFFYQRSDSICHLSDAPNWRCLPNAYLQRCNTRRPGSLLSSYRKAVHARVDLERFDAIVCDSNYVRQRYLEQGFAPDRLTVLPSPVDLPVPAMGEETRRDESLVLFVGRVTPHKGLHFLLEASSNLLHPFRLVVAGDGYDLPRCRALARDLGLERRVTFAGRLDRVEVQRFYRSAALLVVPSVWPEPLGMVGPEAMAFGLPVVAFDAGGISEWLADGDTGLLASRKDTRALREQIDLLLGDPLLRTRLGENGRRLARERFSLTPHVQQLVQLFQTLISRRTAQAAAR
jgi:glycosyltransferase involved in cell wall biosynthesis